MTGAPLGGALKVAIAIVIGWAWLSGNLATITADVLARFGGAAPATGSGTGAAGGSGSAPGGIT